MVSKKAKVSFVGEIPTIPPVDKIEAVKEKAFKLSLYEYIVEKGKFAYASNQSNSAGGTFLTVPIGYILYLFHISMGIRADGIGGDGYGNISIDAGSYSSRCLIIARSAIANSYGHREINFPQPIKLRAGQILTVTMNNPAGNQQWDAVAWGYLMPETFDKTF
jgi:hypothetical protein